ncbi:hypothetical protein C4D60_Mb07t03140 [Musa balbisiana]|uniref:Uncharacterized protein n=1 Tax=Musa balbisiana TaxID=52838 RepID=A0A4S8JCK7_MUSBA|nr:hypothetical protein C4D60_Mb07t03140 [Musa balbisiana]
MGEGIGEDKVGGGGDEDAQEEEGPGDHCVPNVGLVDAHPPEAGPEAHDLVVNAREATCIRCLAKQQWLDATAGGQQSGQGSTNEVNVTVSNTELESTWCSIQEQPREKKDWTPYS